MNILRSRIAQKTSIVFLCIGLAAALGACTKKKSEQAPSGDGLQFSNENRPVDSLTPMEAQGLMRNDFGVLVDVRESNEPVTAIASGAVQMALSEIQAQSDSYKTWLAQVGTDKQFIFYGTSEAPARTAYDLMKSRGYRAGYLASYQAWIQLKLPITSVGPQTAASPTPKTDSGNP